MNKLKTVIATIVTHKKKCAFAVICASYGIYYIDRYRKQDRLFASYCLLAKTFGDEFISPTQKSRKISVIINETAKKGKCRYDFEKYALPLLHLAGLDVFIMRPKNEEILTEICSLISKNDVDAVYVVGGDGTLSTVVNGMMKSENKTSDLPPLGVFPGGLQNRFVKQRLPLEKSHGWDSLIRWYCQNAMSIIKSSTRSTDIVKLTFNDDGQSQKSPLYACQYLHFGPSFSQVELDKYKYWYYGSFKRYFAYFWNWIWTAPNAYHLDLEYEKPCQGCPKCRRTEQKSSSQNQSWLSRLLRFRAKTVLGSENIPVVENLDCGVRLNKNLHVVDLLIDNDQKFTGLNVQSGPEHLSKWQFLKESLRRAKLERLEDIYDNNSENFLIGSLVLEPKNEVKDESFTVVVDGNSRQFKEKLDMNVIPDALKILI